MSKEKLKQVFDIMFKEGTEGTLTDNWLYYFKYWKHDYGIEATESRINKLYEMFQQHKDVLDVQRDEDCLNVIFSNEVCPYVED